MTVPRKYRSIFQDSIVVEIPLNSATADLGVAMKHARAKRIKSIYQHFPSLEKQNTGSKTTSPDDDNEAQDDDDNEGDDDQKKPVAKRKKQNVDETLPQREQYGSVVDYLEAKYVRGVMLGDEIDEGEAEDDRESVYDSEDSWLDDSLLKRDVAEQVLSHSTQTKVGVENDDEDDFFVNVGNLEVEENELMNYDPLEDEKAAKKAKKRKRSSEGSAKSAKSGKGSAKATPKKKKSDSATKPASAKKKNASAKDGDAKDVPEDLATLRKKVSDLQVTVKDLFDRLVREIKALPEDDLPQRNKSVQVTLTVPLEGFSSGETVTFSNPHVPGQRLKVAVPPGKGPGDRFQVHVPTPEVQDEGDGNKFSREFQELAAEYSTVHDLLRRAEAECHAADPETTGKYKLKEKIVAKFDEVIKAFPSNLVTPVDADYMKKIVRRARQNKKKRKEAMGGDVATATVAAAAKPDVKPSAKKSASKPAAKLDVKSLPKATKHKLMKAVKPVKKAPQPEVAKTIEIVLPSKGRVFPHHELRHEEFDGMTKE